MPSLVCIVIPIVKSDTIEHKNAVGIPYRFLVGSSFIDFVLINDGASQYSLTHKASGASVARFNTLRYDAYTTAKKPDLRKLARAELDRVIDRVGIARVLDVIEQAKVINK